MLRGLRLLKSRSIEAIRLFNMIYIIVSESIGCTVSFGALLNLSTEAVFLFLSVSTVDRNFAPVVCIRSN